MAVFNEQQLCLNFFLTKTVMTRRLVMATGVGDRWRLEGGLVGPSWLVSSLGGAWSPIHSWSRVRRSHGFVCLAVHYVRNYKDRLLSKFIERKFKRCLFIQPILFILYIREAKHRHRRAAERAPWEAPCFTRGGPRGSLGQRCSRARSEPNRWRGDCGTSGRMKADRS